MVLVLKFQFGEEIRRVTAEKQLAFNEVIDLAKTLFRGHLPASIALKYKDDEGDIITVGTQRELEEAYRVSKDGVLRFMITEGKIPLPQEPSTYSVPNDIIQLLESTLKQVSQTPNGIQLFLSSLLTPPPSSSTTTTAPSNATDNNTTTCNNTQPEKPSSIEPEIKITVDIVSDEEKPLHPARCDSCQIQIRGFRYKCKDCPDYDLCEVCEPNKAGIHSSQHSFMKIPKPTLKKPEKEPEPPKTQPTPPPQYPAQIPEVKLPIVEPVKLPEPSQPIPKPATPEPLDKPIEKPVETPTEKPVEKPAEKPVEKPAEKPVEQKPEPKKEPAIKKPTLFEDHQRKLEDMGFTNKSRNLALLIQENGNLVEVVKHLLDG
jgi:hypothetical protein